MKYLVKYSAIEFEQTWWFLNEIYSVQHFTQCISKTMLKALKDIKCARFVKRYDSEEKLNIDVDLTYGMHSSFMMKNVS